MVEFAKVAAALALAAALIMPASRFAFVACDHTHESDGAAESVCLCLASTALANDDSMIGLTSPDTARPSVAVDMFIGDPLPADIFRPPAAC